MHSINLFLTYILSKSKLQFETICLSKAFKFKEAKKQWIFKFDLFDNKLFKY